MDNKSSSKSLGNVIVLGLQGEGKSTLINMLLGKEVAKVANEEEVLGETVTVSKYEDLLIGTNTLITLYDVPGYGNLKLNDAELLELWKTHFSNIDVKAILYVASLTRNRIFRSDIYLLEITRLLFQEKQSSEQYLPPLILVGTHADKIDNLESKLKETMHYMMNEINSYSSFKIKDYIVVSNKINNTNEFQKLNKFFLNSSFTGRTKSHLVVETIKNILTDQMKMLGFECFDGNVLVNKRFGDNIIKSVYMKDLEVGDLVECQDGLFERILTKTLHKDHLHVFNLLSFRTNSDSTIQLTKNHYMHIFRDGRKLFIPAKEARVNDHLFKRENNCISLDKIKEIKSSFSNIVLNIRTPSRTIIVNDFLSSCMVEGDAGELGHSILLLANKIDNKLPQKLNRIGRYIQSLFNN
jgi:GTPase Era involved in 16S rRNA processing